MTPLDHTAVSLLGALGVAALKATLLLALGAGTVSVLRRRSAALKHAIWTMALGATMAVLVLPVVVPTWSVIPVPVRLGDARAEATAASATSASVKATLDHRDDHVERLGVRSSVSSNDPRTSERWARAARWMTDHWPTLLAALWLVGVILVLARHLLGLVALRRLCRRARMLGDSAGAALGRRLAEDLHIGRAVTFLSSDDIELPLTWGIVHPRVLLPAHAADWHEDRLQHVLQHELAHVKRLDAGTQFVAGVACATFWFHPLTWHATRQMRYERERACDDRVLARGVVPSAYASDLLALIDAYGAVERHQPALAMTGGSTLEGRVRAVLDPTIDHGAVPRGHMAIGLLLAFLFVVPAAALRGTSPQPATPATFVRAVAPDPPPIRAIEDAALVPAGHTASLAPPRSGARTISVADLFEGCRASGSHLHDNRDPVTGRRLWTASVLGADCRGELIAHGEITFNRDVTGIERMSDDGDIEITASMNGDTTRLAARAADTGAIIYTFVRNGQPADFDADGHAWLASFLLTLDRHTAFAIDQRLPLLLEAGGAAKVLDEIDLIGTEHARVVYLVALAARTALTDSELDRAMGVVARLTNDHDRLDGLLALARRNRFEGAHLDAYLNVAAALVSVGERRRALNAINHR